MTNNMASAGSSLKGLKVVVTRPQQQAAELMSLLEQQGAIPIHLPMLEICPISEEELERSQAIRQKVLDLDNYQHLIFVSTNAAQAGCYWIEQYWPQWPVQQTAYAIGKVTAGVLKEYGCTVVSGAGAMNSEALLALPSLQKVDGEKVLIFRGVGGREFLANSLRERGAQVDYCEVYFRKRPEYVESEVYSLFRDQQIDLLVITSGEGLENLCASVTADELEKIKANISLIVPGERVAALAKEKGFTNILISLNATNEQVLDTASNWYQRK